jgi:hypothetical protein
MENKTYIIDGTIVNSHTYVSAIYRYISVQFFNVSDYFEKEPSLNLFLNKIGYPMTRNVNHDMVIYWIRDNRELVEFNLL